NQFPQTAGRRFVERSAGTLGGIGQHYDTVFAILRFGARITERSLESGRVGAAVLLQSNRFSIEILHQCRSVMLLDEIDDGSRQTVLAGEGHTVLDVADDDQRAERGFEPVMSVLACLI